MSIARELTLEEAALAYAKAKAALDAYEGEKRGPLFAERIAIWRGAVQELTAASIRHANVGAAA